MRGMLTLTIRAIAAIIVTALVLTVIFIISKAIFAWLYVKGGLCNIQVTLARFAEVPIIKETILQAVTVDCDNSLIKITRGDVEKLKMIVDEAYNRIVLPRIKDAAALDPKIKEYVDLKMLSKCANMWEDSWDKEKGITCAKLKMLYILATFIYEIYNKCYKNHLTIDVHYYDIDIGENSQLYNYVVKTLGLKEITEDDLTFALWTMGCPQCNSDGPFTAGRFSDFVKKLFKVNKTTIKKYIEYKISKSPDKMDVCVPDGVIPIKDARRISIEWRGVKWTRAVSTFFVPECHKWATMGGYVMISVVKKEK